MDSFAIFYNSDVMHTLQGIRKIDNNNFIVVGTSVRNNLKIGTIYIGPINLQSKSIYTLIIPDSIGTSIYGPDVQKNYIRLVGSYTSPEKIVHGFIYVGTLVGLSNPIYRTVTIGSKSTILHSISGEYVVGNALNDTGNESAFIYNINNESYEEVIYPKSDKTTLYGITYDGKYTYTLCGGYIAKNEGYGFLVNYNACNKTFSKWFSYFLGSLTHFQGISLIKKNTYNILVAYTINEKLTSTVLKVFEKKHNFKAINYINIPYTNEFISPILTSISGNNAIGNDSKDNTLIPFQLTIL